jgi:hypothetical protein
MTYTKKDIDEAYEKIIWAQGLIDFILRSGFNLNHKNLEKTEGSLTSIFSILDDCLEKGSEVLEGLDYGNEDKFVQIWKQEDQEEGAEQ